MNKKRVGSVALISGHGLSDYKTAQAASSFSVGQNDLVFWCDFVLV